MRIKKAISAEQRKNDPHAGPGDSFPLDPEHIYSAWDLAGHAADPEAVRSRVLAYAKAHGLMDRLPMSAQEHAKKAKVFKLMDIAHKAAHTGLVGALLNMAWQHESGEGDIYEKQRLVMWAQQNGVVNLLPDDAHSFMHDNALPHDHGDGAEKHSHVVMKAFVAGIYQKAMVHKAWQDEDGTTHFEGWMTTEHRDREKDIVPPECFTGCIDEYMANCAPLSSEHATDPLPVGHLQQLALVRDGVIFKAAKHPTDGADFEHFPDTGTGAFCRGVINTPSEAHAVAKGNMGGMSWIGKVTKYEPLPGGGKKYIEVSPLVETTLAAYPVNPHAIVLAAKAYNLDAELPQENAMPTPKKNDAALDALMNVLNGEDQEIEIVTKAEVDELLTSRFAEFSKQITEALGASVAESVAKAMPAPDREGVGRKGVVAPAEDTREADPAAYIAKASQKPDEMTTEDKQLAFGIFASVLKDGMRD